jgi:hypothetical protein
MKRLGLKNRMAHQYFLNDGNDVVFSFESTCVIFRNLSTGCFVSIIKHPPEITLYHRRISFSPLSTGFLHYICDSISGHFPIRFLAWCRTVLPEEVEKHLICYNLEKKD